MNHQGFKTQTELCQVEADVYDRMGPKGRNMLLKHYSNKGKGRDPSHILSSSLAHRPQLLEEFGLLHAREAMRALYMDSLEEFVEDRGASRPFVNSHTRIPEYLLSLLSV